MAGMTIEQKIAKLARDQLSGLPAQDREDQPGRPAVFPGTGRAQQQTRRHDAGARGGAPRLGRASTASASGRGRASAKAAYHVPLSRRQRVDRASAGQPPGARRRCPASTAWTPSCRRRCDYDRLDEAACADADSPAQHRRPGAARGAAGARVRSRYVRDGEDCTWCAARSCILACYNACIPHLVPELPQKQKEALAYSVKVPMMYNNVLIRRWTAFQKLGVSSINAPCMYHTEHQPRSRDDHRRLPGRHDAGRTDRRAPGAQPEQAGAPSQGAESHRAAGAARHDVRAVRAARFAASSRASSRAADSIRRRTSSASP